MNFLTLTLLLIFISPCSESATLKELYTEALKTYPQLAAQHSNFLASETRYNSALRSLGPVIQLKGTQIYREEDRRASGFAQGRERSLYLNAIQPLFKGGREYAGLSYTQNINGAEEMRLSGKKRSVYQEVVKAFFTCLIQDKEIFNQEKLVDLTAKRVSDLNSRVKIGRSRKSELLLAQAQNESAKAQLEVALREKEKALAELKRISGIDERESLSFTAKEFHLKPLPSYLEKLDLHPDLQTKVREVAAQNDNLQVAYRTHLPDLDFRGNYFLHREGALKNVSWDVSLNLTMPIFESGVTTSRIHEEVYKKEQQEHLLNDVKNTLEATLKQIYSTLEKDLIRLNILKKASLLAEENYSEQQKEYHLGLVSNLEVLQAMNTYIENKKSFDRAFYEVEQNKELLLSLTGESENL